MTYPLEQKVTYNTRLIPVWLVMAAQGGFINGFGFYACGKYVSHVTGYGTAVGIAFGEQQIMLALEVMLALGVFISGSFVSACATSIPALHGKRPYLREVNLFIALLLGVIALGGYFGWFGPLGDQIEHVNDGELLLALAFVCGMQNGTFSLLTQGQIRTTHLTGLSTDLGSDVARLLFARKHRAPVSARRVTLVRFLLLLVFALGAVAAVVIGKGLGYGTLLIPVIVAIPLAIYLHKQILILTSEKVVLAPESGNTQSASQNASETKVDRVRV